MFEPIHTFQGKMHLCNERTFWHWFYKDLSGAHKIVQIVSPYITVRRSGKLSRYFRRLISRGVEVIIYTRPAIDHDTDHMKINAKFSILALKNMGVKFHFSSKTHLKVAVIDKHISWSGSLNILSWRDTAEQMNRFDCPNVANDYIREFDLQT